MIRFYKSYVTREKTPPVTRRKPLLMTHGHAGNMHTLPQCTSILVMDTSTTLMPTQRIKNLTSRSIWSTVWHPDFNYFLSTVTILSHSNMFWQVGVTLANRNWVNQQHAYSEELSSNSYGCFAYAFWMRRKKGKLIHWSTIKIWMHKA